MIKEDYIYSMLVTLLNLRLKLLEYSIHYPIRKTDKEFARYIFKNLRHYARNLNAGRLLKSLDNYTDAKISNEYERLEQLEKILNDYIDMLRYFR